MAGSLSSGGSGSEPIDSLPESVGQGEPLEPAALRCIRHPKAETYLRCGKCGDPICARCVVLTPVGARCRPCANPRRLPTFDVTPLHYARAIAAGVAASVLGGWLASYLRVVVPMAGLLTPIALGYLVGEAVSLAVNRKRGTSLKVIAGTGVVLAFVVQQVAPLVARAPVVPGVLDLARIALLSLLGLLAAPIGLILLALGVYIAVSRV